MVKERAASRIDRRHSPESTKAGSLGEEVSDLVEFAGLSLLVSPAVLPGPLGVLPLVVVDDGLAGGTGLAALERRRVHVDVDAGEVEDVTAVDPLDVRRRLVRLFHQRRIRRERSLLE